MRVTFQSQTRNYLSRMNNNLTNLAKSNEKLASGRKYMKGNENVIDAGKALKIRNLISDSDRYQINIRDAEGRTAAAEQYVRTLNGLLTQAQDSITYGLNGTLEQSDLDILAHEVSTMQDEMLQLMNATYSDKFVFGAAGNADGSAPFTIAGPTTLDPDGNPVPEGTLMYNGTPVDAMQADPTTGKPTFNGSPIQYNKDNYVDIGFGYNINGGVVDPNTAVKDTFSGAEIFGFGTNADGVPLNAYSLLGKMVTDLRAGDTAGMNEDLGAISDTMNYLLKTITEIGARGVTMSNTAALLDAEYENLLDVQNKLEYVDYSEDIIYNKGYEMSWMVTLQLGSKILPTSIFSFLN